MVHVDAIFGVVTVTHAFMSEASESPGKSVVHVDVIFGVVTVTLFVFCSFYRLLNLL